MRIASDIRRCVPGHRHPGHERGPGLLGAPAGVDDRDPAVELEQVDEDVAQRIVRAAGPGIDQSPGPNTLDLGQPHRLPGASLSGPGDLDAAHRRRLSRPSRAGWPRDARGRDPRRHPSVRRGSSAIHPRARAGDSRPVQCSAVSSVASRVNTGSWSPQTCNTGTRDRGRVRTLGAERPVPVERSGGTDLAQRRDVAVRVCRAETGRGQERLGDDPARCLDQGFRDERQPEDGDVRHSQALLRSPERLAQRRAVWRRHRGERRDRLRMLAGKSPRDGATPVVAGDVEAVPAESGGDGQDVRGELGHPVRLDALGTRALASTRAGSARRRRYPASATTPARRASTCRSAETRGAGARAHHRRDPR